MKDAQTYPFDEFRREMGWDALPKRAVTEEREDIINSILPFSRRIRCSSGSLRFCKSEF
ncbi:hypothetical protein [Megasphaera elsdenii]|uniref:hypothetical protein n=1 Tax=Megasphaera elsdenii TaxID=907 RepID=UPI0015B87AF5|nr:hypothetical protein [Megasphaera elsdenii]